MALRMLPRENEDEMRSEAKGWTLICGCVRLCPGARGTRRKGRGPLGVAAEEDSTRLISRIPPDLWPNTTLVCWLLHVSACLLVIVMVQSRRSVFVERRGQVLPRLDLSGEWKPATSLPMLTLGFKSSHISPRTHGM